jgi:hypothetical protein
MDYHTFINRKNKAIIDATITVYSNLNEVHAPHLYLSKRDRDLVQTRTLIWSYLRFNTTMSYQSLGKMFNRDHSTVIHAEKTHAKCMGVYANGKTVDPDYQRKYFEGIELIRDLVNESEVSDTKLKYKVIIYADAPQNWNEFAILSASEIITLPV